MACARQQAPSTSDTISCLLLFASALVRCILLALNRSGPYHGQRPNNSFKPNLLRYTNNMAGKACHVVGSTTQVGLTQALDRTENLCMFDKILLSIDLWHISIGLFGLGALKIAASSGRTAFASATEKGFILQAISTLDARRLTATERDGVLSNMLSDFGIGIHEKRQGSPYSMVYNVAFHGSPGSQVDNYIHAYRNSRSES